MLKNRRICEIHRVNIKNIMIMWLTGGCLYFYMEILCRGYSHISMFICAGICFNLVGARAQQWLRDSLSLQGIYKTFVFGAAIITAMELLTGMIVNVWLGLDVWDYSRLNYNLLGQICPTYTCLWGIVSIPAVYLYMLIKNKIFQEN